MKFSDERSDGDCAPPPSMRPETIQGLLCRPYSVSTSRITTELWSRVGKLFSGAENGFLDLSRWTDSNVFVE